MSVAHWSEKLVELNACSDAVEWARTQKSVAAAWRNCERADWMMWILGKLSGEPESAARKKLVLCVCACARTALKYVPKEEKRPLIAIRIAEKWAKGKATIEEVRNAAYAAYAAANAAAAYAAANAANAAAANARQKVQKKCAALSASFIRLHQKSGGELCTG